jgi:hypothetical protein
VYNGDTDWDEQWGQHQQQRKDVRDYDIVIGLPLRQADWGKLARRVGARLRRRATNSSREVVLWRQ